MPEQLSPRQSECLKLSADMSDKDIARHLGITPSVVNKHIQEAMRRLGVNDRKSARRSMGYFTPAPPDPMGGKRPPASEQVVAQSDVDHPPTRYRPVPGGRLGTLATIGQFALFGGLLMLVIIVVSGLKLLK